jgi:ubiquinone biosynthesis protein
LAVQRIVVASDQSQTATRAVKWAAEMASRYDAELIVVQLGDIAEADVARYAEEVAGPGTRGIARTAEDPALGIVAAAEEMKADILVVGNLGMSGRREFLLGNVPNRVSHNARCTVVIVNTAEPEGGFRLPWKK